MRTETIHFADQVKDQLRMALIGADDLREALQRTASEPVASPPGCLRSRPTLAVPRPMDPETAEMRQLEVFLRPVDGGLEVFAVRGLDLAALE